MKNIIKAIRETTITPWGVWLACLGVILCSALIGGIMVFWKGLVITNLTNEEIRIFFPFGTVFIRGLESEQNVVAYATELTLLPTPTAVPTDTPTAVPTDTPTAVPAPTETPAAPEILPVTGASSPPDASGNSLPLLATLLSAGLFAGGWFLWARRRPLS